MNLIFLQICPQIELMHPQEAMANSTILILSVIPLLILIVVQFTLLLLIVVQFIVIVFQLLILVLN